MPDASILTGGLLALGLSAALQPLAMRMLRRWQIIDQPTQRSSHATPTLRGGGIAVVLALLLGAAATGALQEGRAATVLVVTALCAAVGLAEDVRGVPVLPRFALLLLACLPLAFLVPGAAAVSVALGVIAVAFAVGTVNAVNFMDGINGISAAQGVVAGVVFAALAAAQDEPELAIVGAATAGATAAFAPYNVPRARVFLGDTGSYGLGGVLAATAVVLIVAGTPVEAALAPLAIYLADTAVTLVRRFRAGEAWHLPHRTHAYQRLTDLGYSHVQISTLVLVLLAVCAALGGLSLLGGGPRVLGDLGLTAVVLAYLSLPRLVASRRSLA